ncbi:MAG: 3-oxoacyl-[acyl-carrier-protein] reductase [Anaerolineae bacterium]|jgi:3-oxoacyl-[acyl-carrier protein] reductase|nr:3-oxoacyl-[acyl-carrier-protein] reductase [Anaerolineae bacterium]
MSSFEDRIVLITGSGQGIGKAIALELAGRGATIVTNDIAEGRAEAALEEVRAAGGDGLAITADVSNAEQVEGMVKTVIDTYGQIDVLVNNAGTTRDSLIIRMDEEEYDFILRVNLKSAWLCSKAVIRPMMRKRYGRIVNMSSASGRMGQIGQTNYSTSKAGMIGLTKALAREVGSRGITVNAVAPGFIRTALTEQMDQAILEELTKYIPLGRQGEVQDVANAVAFLASDEASYITGQVLSVDGGLVMG